MIKHTFIAYIAGQTESTNQVMITSEYNTENMVSNVPDLTMAID